jgi:hypothetical protein
MFEKSLKSFERNNSLNIVVLDLVQKYSQMNKKILKFDVSKFLIEQNQKAIVPNLDFNKLPETFQSTLSHASSLATTTSISHKNHQTF